MNDSLPGVAHPTDGSWRRPLAWLLFGIGLVAIVAHRGEFERMDAWAWVALPAFAAAPLVGLHRRPALKWLLASVPFWVFSGVNEGVSWAAVGLTIAALVAAAVRPTLPGRRVRSAAAPLAHLAAGPLVQVTPMHFPGGRQSPFLGYAALLLAAVAAALFAAAVLGYGTDVSVGLAISATLIASTFAFASWFAGRVRLRIDGVGVHGRTLFQEHTARWDEISGLGLRYLFLPGKGVRVVYYVVESTRNEVSFPSSMAGAAELRAAIEAATGLRWSEPEITPTM